MKNTILIKLILLITFFHSFGTVYPSTLTLPKPTGRHSVSTKAIEIRDASRSMLRSSGTRRWMVQSFYPSQPHEQTYLYRPETLKNGVVHGIKVLAWAKPDGAPLTSQKFPLIIFVPGRGGERQQYTILCEELASHGYIVLAIDQPYVSNFVKFPDGTKIVPTFKDVWKVPRDRDYRYQYDDEVIKGSIQDITYILDHLNGLFGDAYIPDHIILMGHSLGGNVAHVLGFQDRRIKAVVDIDSKITEREVYGHIGVPPNLTNTPVLFIRGMMQYQENVGNQLNRTTNHTIWSPMVEHSAFSDDAYFTAKIQGFGKQSFTSRLFNWFFKQGPHFDSVNTNLGSHNVEDWFAIYRKHVTTWLDHRVKSISNN